MGDFGFAVKKAGVNKNVDDCTVQELAASSKFNCFKIAKEGTLTVHYDPSNALGSIVDLPIDYNFNPLVLAFAELQTGKFFAEAQGLGLNDYQAFHAWNNVYTGNNRVVRFAASYVSSWSSRSGVVDYKVKYFLLGDTVKETGTTTTITPTQNYGIKVMNSGYDAQTDNYIEHINWSSHFPPMKIAKTGIMTLTTPANSDSSVSVAHGLGYAPAFMVLRENVAGQFTNLPYLSGNGTLVGPPFVDTSDQYSEAYSTTTNLTVYEHNTLASPITKSYRYIIFAENAAVP